MRCCTGTVRALYQDDPARRAAEGDTLQCEHSNSDLHRMVFRDGAREWDRADDGDLPPLP